MLIIGAKGFAKEVLEIVLPQEKKEEIFFFDNINLNTPDLLYDTFRILRNDEDVLEYFEKVSKDFTIGIGNPHLRYQLYQKFEEMGGEFTSTISTSTEIGNFGVKIENGCNILSGVKISNDVSIGKGTMIYYNSIITHDVRIGAFCEISPGVTLLGRCKTGNFTQIGAGAIIFPDVEIGDNCIIGAGAVVRENLPDNSTAVGVPARVIK